MRIVTMPIEIELRASTDQKYEVTWDNSNRYRLNKIDIPSCPLKSQNIRFRTER